LRRRRFCVNGPKGYVSVKEKPGGQKEIISYPNGVEVVIDGIYNHNGSYWGITPIGHGRWNTGWFPMDQLLVVYVRDDFNDEHRDEFYAYSGSYDAVLSAEKLVVWEWPGSDRAKRILDYDSFVGEQATVYSNPSSDCGFIIKGISAIVAYKDEDGREWGYVNINYTYSSWEEGTPSYRAGQTGNLAEWICLSDPQNSNIPAFNPAPEPVKWKPDNSPEPSFESTFNPLLLIISIAAAVVIVTAVLIIMFRKRTKNKV